MFSKVMSTSALTPQLILSTFVDGNLFISVGTWNILLQEMLFINNMARAIVINDSLFVLVRHVIQGINTTYVQ